jgi:hypothetical protein
MDDFWSALHRVRAFAFAAIGALILCDGLVSGAIEVSKGFRTGIWRFASFGSTMPNAQHFVDTSSFVGRTIDVILSAPVVVVALIIGTGLIWQGLRGMAAS